MSKYYKRSSRSKRNFTTSKSQKIDYSSFLYYGVIGGSLYLFFMMIRSLTLGNGNKSSFFDWLKNMGSILDDKISNIGSSNSDAGSSQFDESENNGNSETGTIGIIKSQYFKESEYFPSCKPTDTKRVGNYNRLIKSLDRVRSEWGSPILVVSGFECDNSEKLPAFDDCRAVMIKAQNGKNRALFDKMKLLINSGTIQNGELRNIAIVDDPKDSDFSVRYIIN